MSHSRTVFLVTLALCAAKAGAQSSTRQPNIGYLYPSGGQQGSVIQIIAGGQYLGGAKEVYVSGDGVKAKVVRYIRPLRNLQREQRELLQDRLKEIRDKRLAELPMRLRGRSESAGRSSKRRSTAKKPATPKKEEQKKAEEKEEVKLPDHPLLVDMDDKSFRELAHIRDVMFFPRSKQQLNRQLAEMVLVEITIDADAAPGKREFRLATKTALTNPVVFEVGTWPEVRELEPNNEEAYPKLPNLPKQTTLPKDKPLDLPVLLNGQIMPGDVDRFRFRARSGQQLVIEVQARSLIPYLADAVPGWFQATLALYDARGNEVAYADDYRFNPDPVLFYRIPAGGEYELEIRDSIYRGREDFVYRIAVGERPFITQTFPLGGKVGAKTVASVSGWNVPTAKLALDTQRGGSSIRQTAYESKQRLSNPISYAVDDLSDCNEVESNNSPAEAQRVHLPAIVNGCIERPGDVDVFRFEGRAGGEIVAEVVSRRLNSPLDSLLRLTDASGTVLEWNDDHVLKDNHLHTNMMGLNTHHADSYLHAKLPKQGTYYVHLADSQHHGGPAYGYRLRVTAPQPDFALRVAPSGMNVRAGGFVPISVHVLRKDGYDGRIEVLLKDAPAGFSLQGNWVPAGSDRVRMMLKVPVKAPPGPVALKLQGRAVINGKVMRHDVVPADDVMQAFLYRHLVPAQELLVAVQKSRWGMPSVELLGSSPVRLRAGGSTQVRIKTRKSAILKQMRLSLDEPPEGVTMEDVTVVPEGLAFTLKADRDKVQPGLGDNLIVEVEREYEQKGKDGKPSGKMRRYTLGTLPAIPIEIVP